MKKPPLQTVVSLLWAWYYATMKSCALIFTGGKGPLPGFDTSLIPPCSYVCAVDSGVDSALALGYHIDEALGDFDSISGLELLETINHTRLPQDKDVTDTEAMLKHIANKGYDRYVLVGGGEGRFDHLLHLYTIFSTYGPPELWITACEYIYLVRNTFKKELPIHSTISIIPSLVHGQSMVTSADLYWALNDFPISLDSQSISNRVDKIPVTIEVSGDPIFVSTPFS